MIKQRIFALIIALISIAILYWNWQEAKAGGAYHLKAAAFAPLGIVGGVFLTFFPQFFGRPETSKEKIVAVTIFAIGIAAGLYNWYLIDPGVFPF